MIFLLTKPNSNSAVSTATCPTPLNKFNSNIGKVFLVHSVSFLSFDGYHIQKKKCFNLSTVKHMNVSYIQPQTKATYMIFFLKLPPNPIPLQQRPHFPCSTIQPSFSTPFLISITSHDWNNLSIFQGSTQFPSLSQSFPTGMPQPIVKIAPLKKHITEFYSNLTLLL